MSKLINVMLVSLLFTGCMASQGNINSGMVAYFPFNGNARNMIDDAMPANVDGAILSTDRFGRKNSAYSFDGVEAYIQVEVGNMPASQSTQSFSWWYLVDEIQTYSHEFGAGNMIVLVDSGSGIGIQFGFRGDGYNTLGLDTWNWGGGTLLEVAPPAVKDWHHCVYTYDGATHRFYLDGNEIASSHVEPQKGTPKQLMLGNYPSGDQFYKGKLDDLRIYNRVLNPAEIYSLYAIDK